MAKVLLVDTNFSSIPIYNALQQSGHDVHVVGGNPHDALAKISANYHCLDYSNTLALSDFVISEQIQHLIPGCTDRSYESCVAVGQGTALWLGDNADAFKAINNKAEFRKVAAHLGLPIPKVFSDRTSISGSVIVKPVDSFSGKGITVLHTPDSMALITAIEHAEAISHTGTCIIEEFVRGQLFSYSAFLEDQEVIEDFMVREDCTINPFAVDTSHLVMAGVKSLRMELRRCIEALAKYLRLSNGLLHTQLIHDGNQFWLIELTRRCPGDLYSTLIELSSGFPYASFYAHHFLGHSILPDYSRFTKNIIRHTLSTKLRQSFTDICFLQPVQIECQVTTKSAGDFLEPTAQGRIGVFFFRESSEQSMDTLYQTILNGKLYVISGRLGLTQNDLGGWV